MAHQLVTLREQPQHLAIVAAWIHRQWWSGTDTPVEAIEGWLGTHLGEAGLPSTFLIVSEGEPMGSVSLHDSEAAEHPDYQPYLGALFVKPDSRGRGFGVALVRAVEAHASQLGHAALYLNAADAMAPFYEALGWRVIERGYGRKELNIMQRSL